jgi:hypothetical protein
MRAAAPPNFVISEGSRVETGIEQIVPSHLKGRFAIVTDARRDAVDADAILDECA